jgi:opacity protein-like surface antigen
MKIKTIYKQRLAAIISFAFVGFASPTWSAESPEVAPAAGFYGGVSMRDHGTDGVGLQSGAAAASTGTRFAAPTPDDSATRARVFGGYRWRNDVAVEASFSSIDKYALRPADPLPAHRGVGLGIGAGADALGPADLQSRSWNLDVYTSWAFYRTFSLYGRLGYAQAEAAPLFAGASLTSGVDPRRLRDGVNYGVGLRYDLKSDLGLRLEYARFNRFGIDTGSVLPESDQVSLGVQFRF